MLLVKETTSTTVQHFATLIGDESQQPCFVMQASNLIGHPIHQQVAGAKKDIVHMCSTKRTLQQNKNSELISKKDTTQTVHCNILPLI